MVMGVGHSVAFHIDATGQDQNENVGSREGIWWLPNATANDYLILTNQGQNPLDLVLSLFDASGKPSVQNFRIPPRGMNRLSIRQLVSGGELAGSYGGIKASATTHAGSLDTLHVLFDENAGFSAVMKMFFYDPRAQLKERDYAATGKWTLRAPMLALSNPDPALAFPVGTTLRPRLLIHNNVAKPTDGSLSFNWQSDARNGQVAPTALHLGPFETQLIDVASLQSCKVIPGAAHWASVTLTTSGLPDEVSAVAASFDETLKYGAQTPFSDQLAAQWVGGQWQYDPQHDSIITAGNGSTHPTQAAFTIFYNQGSQKYELDQTLQPGDQMWMDIGKLIRESVLDKNGKALPSDLTSGSYDVRDLGKQPTLFEGKVIYDKTYGHVTYGCAACCGWTNPALWYDPIGVFFGDPGDDGVWAWYPCGSEYDDLSSNFYFNWSSGNTSIVTVDSYGTHTGVAVGSTTSQTHGCYQSNDAHINCPNICGNPSGGANVAKLTCTPSSVTRGSSVTCSVTNAPSGATFSNWTFTDSNNNTVTTTQTNSSWSGIAVASGTVSVQVSAAGSNTATPTASLTVTNRNWHTNAATATEVPNGTFYVLPVPPQPTGSDAGVGQSNWQISYNPIPSTTISDNGPNNGYYYYTNFSVATSAYQYEINPDLENTSSTFYQAQCGNYNAATNPSGFISGSALLTQTNRHEWNSTTQSHYAFYSNGLSSNNLGNYVESRVAPPGTNTSNFDTDTKNGITSDLTAINNAFSVQPYAVNESESGVLLGNINYSPYARCN